MYKLTFINICGEMVEALYNSHMEAMGAAASLMASGYTKGWRIEPA